MTPKILAIAAALPFFLAAKSTSAVPNNSEFKIGISQEFETLNPLIMSMSATSYMARLAVRTLVVLDANSKWIPQLAKAIPSIENGMAKIIEVDGTKKIVTQWEILENASWGDGKPVTCEDFRLALKIASSPHVSIGEKETYTQIEKIEWDPKTPKIAPLHLQKPAGISLSWDLFFLSQSILKSLFLKNMDQPKKVMKRIPFTQKNQRPQVYITALI
jgi:peptide/nickel transport system substrate-binding protein